MYHRSLKVNGPWKDNGGKKVKGRQGTHTKDPWTKPMEGEVLSVGGEVDRSGESGEGKMGTTEQQLKK